MANIEDEQNSQSMRQLKKINHAQNEQKRHSNIPSRSLVFFMPYAPLPHTRLDFAIKWLKLTCIPFTQPLDMI